MNLCKELADYVPFNEQEEQDRELILNMVLSAADKGANGLAGIYGREYPAHLTASGWVVSPSADKVLMAYHNIYDSWSWLGGHADGERDLKAVALREVREESGLASARLAVPSIFSLEVLTVSGHEKRGKYVSSHLHLNLTYLIEADPRETPRIKPDENSGIAWMSPQESLVRSSEPWFVQRIYSKLIDKVANLY